MNEEEFEQLLEEDLKQADEDQLKEAIRFGEIEREIRLRDAFQELKRTNVELFHQETGGYPELNDPDSCVGPPENYWNWYAQRVIGVARVIVEDGWLDDFKQLQAIETYGKLAIGLFNFALRNESDTLAIKLRDAIRFGTNGQRVEEWLSYLIPGMLRKLYTEQPHENSVDSEGQVDDLDESLDAAPRKRGRSWQEVAKTLIRMLERGFDFTSPDDLAERIKCSANTVRRAIRTVPELQKWASESKKSRTYGFTKLDELTKAQTREVDPAVAVEEMEEAELQFFKLIEEVDEENRGELLNLKAHLRDNPKGFCLWVEQLKDERSDFA